MDVNVTSLQERAKVEAKSYLEQLLSEGARKLLQAAIENEVAVYLQSQSGRRSESGERSVVRNGHLPERDLVTGVGPVKIRHPRVRHRDGGSFSSEILPKYMRRVPSVDALIPAIKQCDGSTSFDKGCCCRSPNPVAAARDDGYLPIKAKTFKHLFSHIGSTTKVRDMRSSRETE